MGAIFSTTVPATIIRSDCRGVPRKTSAPKRERSCRASMTAIISMAQQARPNCIGQIDERRAQLITESTVVVTTLSSNRLSINPMRAALPCGSSPVQGLPLPAVDVPDDQDRQENHHLDQTEEPQPVEHDRPGEEKDRLHVEDDEEDGDQEVPHREPGVEGGGRRLDAALVGLELGRVRAIFLDGAGDDDRSERQSRRQQSEHQYGEVMTHWRGILSDR